MSLITTLAPPQRRRGADPIAPDAIADLAALYEPEVLALSNNDPVSAWEDSGPNNHDVTQATAGKQPLFIENGLNGLPVVRFDGVSQLLVRSVTGGISSAPAGAIVAVYKVNAGSNRVVCAAGDEATNTRYLAAMRYDSSVRPFISQRSGDTEDSVRGGTLLGTTAFHVVITGSTGTQYGAYVDGTPETITLTGGANTGDWFGDTADIDNFAVGGRKINAEALFATIDLAALAVYDHWPTAAEAAGITAHYGDKFALPVA